MDEQLFRVEQSVAHVAETISLAEAGLRERQDLQEWVIAHPSMIGPNVRIVTLEFGQWATARGETNNDRLDVLGLDPDGTLVVVELKRDRAPDSVDMQAIKYAAMASRFTLNNLAKVHAAFLSRDDNEVTEDEALEALTTFAPDLATSEDQLREPRIVLMAREFPSSVTATAVWLTEMGLNMTLVTFQAYRSGDQTLVSVSQLFPVPDIENFTIAPRQTETIKAEQKRRTQRAAAAKRLVEAEAIKDGEDFSFSPYGVSDKLREEIDRWIAENPSRARATWVNDPQAPLLWEADSTQHSPTGLAKHILKEATGETRNFQGTMWWSNAHGETIADLANSLETGRAALYRRFWTELLNTLQINHPGITSREAPPKDNWLDVTPNSHGTHYVYSFSSAGLRVELYIDTGQEAQNLALLRRLESQAALVEQVVQSPVSWEDLPTKRACRVAVYREASIESTGQWPDYVTWLVQTHQRLAEALDPLIEGSEPAGTT